MPRILIADDHAVVRRGLREIIADHPDMDEPAEVPDFPQLLEAVQGGSFDAVLMDMNMPGGDALDTLAKIGRIRPGLPVLILSVHPEDEFAVRMIRAGAAGYLNKESAPEDLMEAIRAVLRGRKWVSGALGARLAESLGGAADRPLHEQLSDREFQVLRLIAGGHTASEIAAELHLSVKTVSTYRARLLEKMGMSTNAELTRYGIIHELA